MAMALTFSVAGVSFAASYVKCEVKAVAGDTVTLECKRNADDLKVGSKVKVSPQRKAIEGC